MDINKFLLRCKKCGNELSNFKNFIESGQRCRECNSSQIDVVYLQNIEALPNIINTIASKMTGLWQYFDFLPLNFQSNIISCGEGAVPIDRWEFLEQFAKEKYGIDCTVYAHRHDCNAATGTFKDLAGSMVASVFKENGVDKYVIASTGNIGVAFSRYLTEADIELYTFIPANSSKSQEAEIGCFGQKVFRVQGDYSKAKKIAKDFASKHNILYMAGTFDPIRIEAKKTMAYEWLRQLTEFPNVYIQALSGGTGPIGIDKGCDDLVSANLIQKKPRFILGQTDRCSPMADAWQSAKKNGFVHGWGKQYPIYENCKTDIATLATGNPVAYPEVSKIVHQNGGAILSFPEDYAVDVARLVAFEKAVRIGPAAATAVGTFLIALSAGHLKDGDRIMLAIGEGIRRSPDFMEQLIYESNYIDSADECSLSERNIYRNTVWERIDELDD